MFSKPRNHALHLILLFLLSADINAYYLDPFLSLSTRNEIQTRALANTDGTPLRVLCLGASITYGLHSTDGNGYRYALRGKLLADGNDVNMIGAVSHGNMSNNEVDGWPGLRIDQVAEKTELSLESMPNLVLLELGTNDMAQDYFVDTAHTRLGSLIGRVLNASPNVTVIVGTLPPNENPNTEANSLIFNANLVGLVANFTAQGEKVSLVDFHSDWWSLADIRSDGTHPTDLGYIKMSKGWYDGIVVAAKAGNFTAPTQVNGVDDYSAGNDSVSAETAINVVCQNVNKSITAQVQACSGASRLGINIAFLAVLIAGTYSLF